MAIGAISGKADPVIVRALQILDSRVTTLQQQATLVPAAALNPAAVAQRFDTTQQALQMIQQQVTQLAKQLRTLQAATAGLTPVPPDTVTSPSGTLGAGSAMPTGALADLAAVVTAYAAAHPLDLQNSCVPSGGTWTYLDGLVAALVAADPRCGFNGKRGNTADPSGDAISYYHGVLPPVYGSNDVYVVDVISGHCGATPGPSWNNVTTPLAAGAWLNTR